MIDINNKKFWNIVKGIGIFSVVIGHCCSFLVRFVYLFHLTIFFFIGGYLYSEKKYGDYPFLLFLQRLKSCWKRYILFGVFFILIHNLLFKLGLLTNTQIYSLVDIITNSLNTLLFFGTETMGGALWFIPVYIFSSTLFGIIVYYARKFDKNSTSKNINIIILSIIFGTIGYYLVSKNISLMLHIQTSFLVIPFLTIGYFIRNNINDLSKYLKLIIFIPVTIILLYIAFKTKYFINLSDNVIGNGLYFFSISLLGVYFCLYMSKLIIKIKNISNCFYLMGMYSFEIMACHFLIFKIVDLIFSIKSIIRFGFDAKLYGLFPYAYKSLWMIYILFGTTIPVLFCLGLKKAKENINDIKKFTLKIFENNKIKIIFLIIFILCISIPIIKLGIMHNDELMSRLWSLKGFNTFYWHYFHEQLEKGRALSCFIIPFTMYLGFIGQKTYTFKFFQIVSIILCVVMFTKLLYKVFKDNRITTLYMILFLSFLPISFEPTVPNVFVTFYNVSICLLIYSFCLYVDYLDTKNIKKLIFSMIIFFIVEITYESFITYVPIFILLYCYRNGFKKILNDLKAILAPIFCGLLYLILYIIFTKIFPSNYAGNQINGINILKSLKIICTLGYYSFPISYSISDKYRWLFNCYYSFNIYDLLRIMAFIIVFIYLYITEIINNKKYDVNHISLCKTIFIGICLIILPILPISVASMYQNMNVGVVTLGLPVSFFSYFGSILIFTYLIIYFSNKTSLMKYIILILVIISVIRVQRMNSVFSREANKNFNRIQSIENLIVSGLFDDIDDDIYASDLFVTKNSLFVHNSHWNDFADYYNISTNFLNKTATDKDNALYYDDELNIFEFIYKKNTYIISEKRIENYHNKCVVPSNEFKLKSKFNLYELDNTCSS